MHKKWLIIFLNPHEELNKMPFNKISFAPKLKSRQILALLKTSVGLFLFDCVTIIDI
jgi:hypothetical protein